MGKLLSKSVKIARGLQDCFYKNWGRLKTARLELLSPHKAAGSLVLLCQWNILLTVRLLEIHWPGLTFQFISVLMFFFHNSMKLWLASRTFVSVFSNSMKIAYYKYFTFTFQKTQKILFYCIFFAMLIVITDQEALS